MKKEKVVKIYHHGSTIILDLSSVWPSSSGVYLPLRAIRPDGKITIKSFEKFIDGGER